MVGKSRKTKFTHFKRKPYLKVSVRLGDLPGSCLKSLWNAYTASSSKLFGKTGMLV